MLKKDTIWENRAFSDSSRNGGGFLPLGLPYSLKSSIPESFDPNLGIRTGGLDLEAFQLQVALKARSKMSIFFPGCRVTHKKWAYLGAGTVLAVGQKRVTVRWDRIPRNSVAGGEGAHYSPSSLWPFSMVVFTSVQD